MGKKSKKDIEKRHAESKEKKQRKRKLKLLESRSKPDVEVMYRPPLTDMGAPEGFRSIPMAQATMEYAKPLIECAERSGCDFNDALQAGMLLWNYATDVEQGEENKDIKETILKALRKTLKFNHSEANEMFDKMVQRHNHLFPRGIQPKHSPYMYVRKEIPTIIRPFDYSSLAISQDIILPDRKDRDVISKINQLDNHIKAGGEYTDEYEDILFTAKDACEERFKKWLTDKGLNDEVELFSGCIDIYLSFIYAYMHDDVVILKSVPSMYLVEFFEDFLLRKMMVDNPNEYVYWSPALKLFYRFIYEKGYLDNPDEIIEEIVEIEPHFIDVLRRQFT